VAGRFVSVSFVGPLGRQPFWRPAEGCGQRPNPPNSQELGVDCGTLYRWWKEGLVEPAFVTASGHARWDVEDLKRQLREQQRTDG
jgi:hypothetical protein